MKIWLGFLDPALESRVSFETGEDDGAGADVAFVTQAGGSGFLPHCDALVEVAKDKFQFHTATEHTGAEAPPPTRDRGQDGSDRTSSRSHVFLDSGAGFLPAPQPSPPLPVKHQHPVLGSQGRLPEEILGWTLEWCERLWWQAVVPKTALEESECEDDDADDLHLQKAKKGSRLEQALDSASGLASQGEGAGVGSRKNSLARRALRAALHESPEKIYNVMERLTLEDLTSRTLVPGMPRPELSARAWLDCLPGSSFRKRCRGHVRSFGSSSCSGPPGLEEDCPLGFPLRQFLLPCSRPRLRETGCLDLFSGSAGLARALLRWGAPWVLTFDVAYGLEQDVLLEPTRSRVLEAVRAGTFKFVAMAPPVGSFSPSVTPRVRNRARPAGIAWLRGKSATKVEADNAVAAFCLDVVAVCVASGTEWTLEHPDSSYLWQLTGFEAYAEANSSDTWRGDMCTFGTPWWKRTKVATSLELKGSRRFCQCRLPHVVLRGRVPGRPGLSRTSCAKPYPRGFSEALAAAAARACGWCSASGKLTLSDCARCGTRRIGEATKPGPRRPPRFREGDLESRPLQSATTLLYEDRLWEDFVVWCSVCLSDPCLLFSLVPCFCAMALRAYGNACYARGKTLSSFRHTIVAAQRRVLGVKPFLSTAWEMVSRWEAVEPPVHRCPIPEALLATRWNMRRWGATTLLAFYGLARIGEVLKCRRRDLLLPQDLLDDELHVVYLNFRESKTATRGRPKVQHTRVNDSLAVALIEQAFSDLAPDHLLWPSSPAAYRYRWDFLLKQLDVPRGLALTPGGLRGGGAVCRYRLGVTPGELQWAMRLKHIATLEHYLQELAAVTALTDVSDHGRSRIRTAAKLYDVVLSWLTSTEGAAADDPLRPKRPWVSSEPAHPSSALPEVRQKVQGGLLAKTPSRPLRPNAAEFGEDRGSGRLATRRCPRWKRRAAEEEEDELELVKNEEAPKRRFAASLCCGILVALLATLLGSSIHVAQPQALPAARPAGGSEVTRPGSLNSF
eukprot:s7219_g2.t1